MSRVIDVVLAQVAVQPVGTVEVAIVQGKDLVGDQRRYRDRPTGDVARLDLGDLVGPPAALLRMPVPDGAREGRADEAARPGGIVEAADLQRHQTLLSEVDRLR